jgi:hydrogenase maturation protease
MTRVVLFGYGNPSRGDDALGPLLLERAEAWLTKRPELDVRVVADFQLQIEHALDLDECDLALFVDADASCPAPCALSRVTPTQDASYSTHELTPEAVLHVRRQVGGVEPPPAFVLRVRGKSFDLGAPLSPAATMHLELAWTDLQHLLTVASAAHWGAQADADALLIPVD